MSIITNLADGANKILKARSPIIFSVYKTSSSESIESIDLYLRIWNGDNSLDKPSGYTYTIQSTNTSFVDIQNTPINFNLSEFCREYLNTNQSTYNSRFACWLEVYHSINYKLGEIDFNTTGSTTAIAVNGWSTAQETGTSKHAKQLYIPSPKMMIGKGRPYPITMIDNATAGGSRPFDSLEISYNNGDSDTYSLGSTGTTTSSIFKGYNLQIPIGATKATVKTKLGTSVIDTYEFEEFRDTKYNVYRVGFIDKNGVFSYLHTIGNHSINQSIKREQYQPVIDITSGGDLFNATRGQRRILNANGNEEITLNTGFVPESHSEVIRELLLSEYCFLVDEDESTIENKSIEDWLSSEGYTIETEANIEEEIGLLGGDISTLSVKDLNISTTSIPIIPRDTQVTFKQSITDRLINYTITFSLANDTINNIF
jgi:hypothetical protein